MLLGMGRDRNDGKIELSENGQPMINWKMKNSELHYARTRHEMARLAKAMGGKFYENPLSFIKKIVAVHTIGGCAMAESPAEGVVSTKGEVFGHQGLYVMDASIMPTSLGPNPSLTIAALTEYLIDQFPRKI